VTPHLDGLESTLRAVRHHANSLQDARRFARQQLGVHEVLTSEPDQLFRAKSIYADGHRPDGQSFWAARTSIRCSDAVRERAPDLILGELDPGDQGTARDSQVAGCFLKISMSKGLSC
jgi:hypothetical protein